MVAHVTTNLSVYEKTSALVSEDDFWICPKISYIAKMFFFLNQGFSQDFEMGCPNAIFIKYS